MTEAGETRSDKKETAKPRIVIVGGGFGGLYAARALARAPSQRHSYRQAQLPPLPSDAISGGYWVTFRGRNIWSAQIHTPSPKKHRRSPGRSERRRYAEARCAF